MNKKLLISGILIITGLYIFSLFKEKSKLSIKKVKKNGNIIVSNTQVYMEGNNHKLVKTDLYFSKGKELEICGETNNFYMIDCTGIFVKKEAVKII